MQEPKHKEPTNYEHCCSCCPELEKRIKHLEYILKEYKERLKNQQEILDLYDEASNTRGGLM